MAIQVRKAGPSIERALLSEYNSLRGTVAVAGSKYHKDVTSSATSGDFNTPTSGAAVNSVAPTAADLPTVLVMANELKAVYNTSILDATAHKVADVTNAVVTANATDQGTANTLLNAIQTQFNLHCVSTTYHYTADTTEGTTAATTLGTSITLANNLKTKINAHINSSPAGSSLTLIEP